ncbi:MAG: 10 kDa chaperonin [Patescibacteria group bacterium]|nr:MAG: 10 kDa chaperonin [Patescibacteria group bacterium]
MSDISVKKIQPLPGYVLVEPAEATKKTASGLYLPENSSDKPQHGTVLAVGDSIWESGVKEIVAPVKVGQTVIYKKWGGNDYKIGDTEYQFLKFEDVLAIVK